MNGKIKSVISFEDMVSLINIYDAITTYGKIMLGNDIIYTSDSGLYGTILNVVSIIEHGTMLSINKLNHILDNKKISAEKRAKLLLLPKQN